MVSAKAKVKAAVKADAEAHPAPVVIDLDVEKETPGTFRYTERGGEGDFQHVGQLYVKKDSPLAGQPHLRMTLEVVEDGG